MKQSPIEPPKKKLKQARLPFQLLSPGAVKNPLETPTQERKRKACDDNSDGDVVIGENTEVKENKLKQSEKKAKVDNNVLSIDETVDLTSVEDDTSEKGSEAMEVEEKKCTGQVMKVATKATDEEKQNKTATPQTPCNKTVTSKKGKQGSTFKVKLGFNKHVKTDSKTDNSKTETITFVDLSDSPVKDNSRNSDLTVLKCESLNKDVSSTKVNTEELQNENELMDVEKNLLNPENENFKESKSKINKTNNETEADGKKDCLSNSSDTASKPTKCVEDIQDLGSKLEETAERKELKSVGLCDNSKGQEDLCPKKNDLLKDINKQKPKAKKNPKKGLVSPSASEKNALSKLLANIVDKSSEKDQPEEKKLKNVYEPEVKSLGGSTSSVSEESSPERNPPSSADDSLFKTPSMINNSLEVSSESESNSTASTPGTPTSSKKSITPSRMTPKQLMKHKEKEAQRKEKERLRQEKERKKEEDKQEKLKLKQEKEEEKLKQKLEKEEEKKREKEEKEKKKQAEIDQKNEEKRLREEEKKSKAEEKRKKEEEERKKKDEKKIKEEQKQAEKRKSAQAFASFFVKSETKGSPMDEDKENTPVESNFQSFEVKADMRLAPLSREQLTDDRRQQLDQALEGTADTLYLQQLRSGDYTRGASEKTWPPPDETDDDVMIIESEKTTDEMETDCVEVEKKSEKKRRRAKLLQFHENRRPPYWGTWRKKSKFVRPRAPLNQDKTMFEYDIDSDDEWEEPEDGESLRGSEDEESQDEQYEEDNDMFVPHGYLSEEEGQDEMDDTSPEAMKAKLKFLQLEFEEEMSKKQEKLKPRVIGCVWFCNSDSDPKSVGSYIAEMFLSRRAVWEGSLPLTVVAPLPASPSTTADSTEQATDLTRGAKKKLVPESMIPEIIKKIHGSRRKLSRLLNEILEDQEDLSLRPSKRCLADKIREIAAWENNAEIGHHCWFVKDEIRQAHDLMDLKGQTVHTLTVPTSSPSPNITKFTKVLTSDERLKLLREAPSTNSSTKESPTINPVSKLSAATTKQVLQGVKMPSIKHLFAGKSSPAGKKRIQPLVSVPPGQSIPKQASPSIVNFVQSPAEPTRVEQGSSSLNTNVPIETEKKTKKRITPITLTTVVAKSPIATQSLPPSQEECIVLSD